MYRYKEIMTSVVGCSHLENLGEVMQKLCVQFFWKSKIISKQFEVMKNQNNLQKAHSQYLEKPWYLKTD